jgi:hypothetical protein
VHLPQKSSPRVQEVSVLLDGCLKRFLLSTNKSVGIFKGNNEFLSLREALKCLQPPEISSIPPSAAGPALAFWFSNIGLASLIVFI